MTGHIRPKSMSIEEAAAYIADPTNWNPVDDERLEVDDDDLSGQAAEQLRRVLRAAGPDEPEITEPDQPYIINPDALRARDEAEQEPADTQPEDEPTPGLRSDEALEADLDVVVGPSALAHTAETRHLATLRLIDDLVEARSLLEEFQRVVTAIGRS